MTFTATTSRVEVTLYPRKLSNFSGALTFKGRDQYSPDGALVSCTTNKTFGSPYGTWSIDVKSANELDAVIGENDWVDIVFREYDFYFHVMRGPVDSIRRVRTVQNGATVETYTISGCDHGKVLSKQMIWLDRLLRGNFTAILNQSLFSQNGDMAFPTPDVATRITLQAALTPANNNAVGYWMVPTMPGIRSSDSFVDNCPFKSNDYSEIPFRRLALQPSDWSWDAPSVWDLAKELADEELCELYVDLVEKSADGELQYLRPGVAYSPDDTQMAIIFRDRPFPNTERDVPLLNSPYFTRIPTADVEATQVLSLDVSKSGTYRRNAFFFSPALAQKLMTAFIDAQYPIINEQDAKVHGMRRQDVYSRYVDFENEGWIGMSKTFRNISRDIHCLDHELLTGTVILKPGRPDLRIGMRLRINYPHIDPETFYIEGVSHSWSLTAGVQTEAVLSRGFRGDDQTFVNVLQNKIDEFTDYNSSNVINQDGIVV